MPEEKLIAIVDLALAEDIGRGDVTSEILIPPELEGQASILIKAEGILAGIRVAEAVFHRVDPDLMVDLFVQDGTKVESGEIVGRVSGRVVSILKAERVALNFLQRLSGIASMTATYVAEVQGTEAGVYDTRKTTPGLRFLEKYAVRMGGGHNHRIDLGDFVLIKDNHIAILRGRGMTLKEIVAQAKTKAPRGMTIEVEVTSPEDAVEAVQAGADIIMFDNMPPDEMRRAVGMLPKKVRTEASGSINLTNVRSAALAGVDIISIGGALTLSAQAMDISLELETEKNNKE
ncbi:MAG: nicotinate-nucleotide diphosphorylase (carboxylating) [Chloroflexi bacterium RBG_16_57_8]|nr:MAG: nicotinate-nucleotide diphosphorylase (carboxylating) [Chloroflexi bacterium RBG_16_57_8]